MFGDSGRAQPQQIRIVKDGLWHRRLEGNGADETVCGIHFPDLIPATRPFNLDELICQECHTRREVQTGEMKALKVEALEKRDAADFTPLRERRKRGLLDGDTHRELPPFKPDDEDR